MSVHCERAAGSAPHLFTAKHKLREPLSFEPSLSVWQGKGKQKSWTVFYTFHLQATPIITFVRLLLTEASRHYSTSCGGPAPSASVTWVHLEWRRGSQQADSFPTQMLFLSFFYSQGLPPHTRVVQKYKDVNAVIKPSTNWRMRIVIYAPESLSFYERNPYTTFECPRQDWISVAHSFPPFLCHFPTSSFLFPKITSQIVYPTLKPLSQGSHLWEFKWRYVAHVFHRNLKRKILTYMEPQISPK